MNLDFCIYSDSVITCIFIEHEIINVSHGFFFLVNIYNDDLNRFIIFNPVDSL
jgi:hypothetical protein